MGHPEHEHCTVDGARSGRGNKPRKGERPGWIGGGMARHVSESEILQGNRSRPERNVMSPWPSLGESESETLFIFGRVCIDSHKVADRLSVYQTLVLWFCKRFLDFIRNFPFCAQSLRPTPTNTLRSRGSESSGNRGRHLKLRWRQSNLGTVGGR